MSSIIYDQWRSHGGEGARDPSTPPWTKSEIHGGGGLMYLLEMWKHSEQCCIFSHLFEFGSLHIYIAPNASFFILKCTKIGCVWGYAPDPAEGANSAPPYDTPSYSCFKLGLRRGPTRIFDATIHSWTFFTNPSYGSELWIMFWPSRTFLIKCDSCHVGIMHFLKYTN